MNRKGISPLIAAVLLIAFTMAIASLFAQWAPGIIQDAQQNTGDQADELQSCSEIALEIKTTTAPNITVQQVSGEQEAGEVVVTWLGSETDQQTVSLTGGTRNITEANTTVALSNLDTVEADPSTDCPGAPMDTYNFSS